MSILVVGMSHRTAPLELLESVSLDAPGTAAALRQLLAGEHVTEAVVLSTCNRVEIYADAATFHGGVNEASAVLAHLAGVELEALSAHLYVHHDARAVQHVLSVACGLDSMLVGEPQILGQLRAAFRLAQEQGTAGRILSELLSNALRVGKRAHTETGIDDVGASLVSVGLDQAERHLGDLVGSGVLVIGAGSTGALAVATLRRRGAEAVTVVNRTLQRADELADPVGAGALSLADLPTGLASADLVVCATAASGFVLTRALVEAAQVRRGHRPLVLLDLALPRDVDPSAADVDGVLLVDLATLKGVLEERPAGAEVELAATIVAEEAAAFVGWQRAASVAPTVVALRAKADLVVAEELDRLASRLPHWDPAERDEVERTVRRVVDKLLHAPSVRVKELASSPGGHSYAEALHELFELGPLVESVSVPAQGELG